jgi:hypothetical protein
MDTRLDRRTNEISYVNKTFTEFITKRKGAEWPCRQNAQRIAAEDGTGL